MKLLISIALAIALSGCSHLPTAADPMPISAVSEGNEAALCGFLNAYGLADSDCIPKIADSGNGERTNCSEQCDKDSPEGLGIRRTELTHRLMQVSTALCSDFRNKLSGRTTGRMAGFDAVATWFTAGATAVSGPGLARGLTGGATAVLGTSNIMMTVTLATSTQF